MRLHPYLLILVLVSSATQIQAAPVTIEILSPVKDNGFHFSYEHTAERSDPTGTYYYGGELTAALSGELTGDLTGGVLTISGGELLRLAKSDGTVPLNDAPYDLTLGTMRLKGVLDFRNQDLNDESLLGSLHYETFDADGVQTDSGTWYFANRDFSNATHRPNNLSDEGDLRLWGNNWPNHRGLIDRASYAPNLRERLGIDLGGRVVTQPIPEPTSVILFVAGGLIVGGAVVRRRQSP